MRKLLQMLVAVAMVLAMARIVYVDFIKESKIVDECDLLPAASAQLVEDREEMDATSKRYLSLISNGASSEEINGAEKAYVDAIGKYTWTADRVDTGIDQCHANTMASIVMMSAIKRCHDRDSLSDDDMPTEPEMDRKFIPTSTAGEL